MRGGLVSNNRWLFTDESRPTMGIPNPMGSASVTVTCDFDCAQRHLWPLDGLPMVSDIIIKIQVADVEVTTYWFYRLDWSF